MKTLLKYIAAVVLFAVVVPIVAFAASFGTSNYFYAPSQVITPLPGFTTSWSGSSQTPWTGNINGGGFNLSNVGNIVLGSPTSIWSVGPTSTLSNSFVINAIASNYPYFIVPTTGNVGIASSSPDALLSVMVGADFNSHAKSLAFEIGSSTANGTATSTLFSVNSLGQVNLGSAPSSVLNVQTNHAGNIGGIDLLVGDVTTPSPFLVSHKSTSANGSLTYFGTNCYNNASGATAVFNALSDGFCFQLDSRNAAASNLQMNMLDQNSNSSNILTYSLQGLLAFGSTTPVANFQFTSTTSNATTSIEFGKANQTKGACLTFFDTAGTPVYGFIAAGATSFTYTTTKPAGCQS